MIWENNLACYSLFFAVYFYLKCLPQVKVSQNVRVDFWVQHISAQASILLDFKHGAVLCYLSRQEPPRALKDVHCWHGLISKDSQCTLRFICHQGWLQISLYIKLWTWTFSKQVIQTTLQNVDTIPLIPTIWWHLPLLIWGPPIYPLYHNGATLEQPHWLFYWSWNSFDHI